jgi:hypothetical protein
MGYITEIQEKKIEKIWSRQVRLFRDRDFIDKYEPSYHILSFGGGRQTVALLIKMRELFSNNKKAFVVFADTGGEHKETYDYIDEYIIPYCKKYNINFVRVYNKYGKTLYDYCYDKKIVPSIKFRDCTSKFKISPIRKFMRKELGITRKNPCNVYIGISYDESDRMNASNVLYAKSVYPFVDGYRDYCDSGVTVLDCAKIVYDEGFPEVAKSGCWFCPFAQTQDLLNPNYRPKTISLEENNSRFPEIKLRGMGINVKSVRDLDKNSIQRDSCKSGYCMV